MNSETEISAAARQLRETWENKTCRYLGSGWDDAFANWIRKFGIGRVEDAMQMAAAPRFTEDGERLSPDIRGRPEVRSRREGR